MPHPTLLTRILAGLAALGAFIGLSALAPSAYAVTVDEAQIDRTGELRDTGRGRYDVSYADCTGSNDYTFVLTGLVIGDALSIWASGSGSDCTTLVPRQDGNCVEVLAESSVSQTSVTVSVGAASVAGSLSSVTGCDDAGGTTAPRPVTLYFLVNASSTDPVVDYDTYQVNVDLLGPGMLTLLDAAPASDSAVVVTWTVATDLSDVEGYQVYCEEASGTGGSAASACSAPTLAPGEVPPDSLACGSTVAANTGKSTVSSLVLGTTYAFGVAGYDVVGNVGVLSDVACSEPTPVDDFFTVYRNAGGKAGGGCALGPVDDGRGIAPGASGWLAALALGLGLRRAGGRS